jgi:hypothetical protein
MPNSDGQLVQAVLRNFTRHVRKQLQMDRRRGNCQIPQLFPLPVRFCAVQLSPRLQPQQPLSLQYLVQLSRRRGLQRNLRQATQKLRHPLQPQLSPKHLVQRSLLDARSNGILARAVKSHGISKRE